jgi:hypothetical protein
MQRALVLAIRESSTDTRQGDEERPHYAMHLIRVLCTRVFSRSGDCAELLLMLQQAFIPMLRKPVVEGLSQGQISRRIRGRGEGIFHRRF